MELLVAGAMSGSAFFHRGSDSLTSLISTATSTALIVSPNKTVSSLRSTPSASLNAYLNVLGNILSFSGWHRAVLDDDARLGAAAREEEEGAGPPHLLSLRTALGEYSSGHTPYDLRTL